MTLPVPSLVMPVLRIGNRIRLAALHAIQHQPPDGLEFCNHVELRAFGLQRSGNHAIINWIVLNKGPTLLFLNYVRNHRHFNPFVSFSRSIMKNELGMLECPPELRSKRCRTWRWHLKHPRKDCLIYSYEDRDLDTLTGDQLQQQHDYCLGKSLRKRDLLILRDPFNTLASRLKQGKASSAVVEMWKGYAREFVGDSHRLRADKVAINYNRWCANAEYRAELAATLDLADPELGVDQVSNIGGGSSFDRTSYDGRAGAMRTAERWRHFQDDREFRRFFADPEVIELSERIFGHIPGTELLHP